MKSLKFFLLPVLGLILNLNVSAQSDPESFNPQLPPVLPLAPNTATLGKFGNYQVNLFSGIPSISIPLYTIKTSGFEVPISLVYHASGIRLHEFPSWVGAGWALDAGGQISRRLVGGKADEESVNGFFNGYPKKAEDITGVVSDYTYLTDTKSGYRDMGADIFSYSFPGANGKFFFDRDNSYAPVLMPYAPIKISSPEVGVSNQLTFNIQDASGNRYEFGKNYSESTETANSSGAVGSDVFYTSAWMLEKMISPNKIDTIAFSYRYQSDASPVNRSDSWVIDDKKEYIGPSLPDPYTPTTGTYQSLFSNTSFASCNQQEIKFKNGRVVFDIDASTRGDFGGTGVSSKALQGIKIYNTVSGSDVLIESIKLYQSYFTDGNSGSERLRLDSLQILDTSSAVINTYRFEYNTSVNLPVIDYTTVSEDYWDYYNGRSNTTLVPQITGVPYWPLDDNPYNTTITIGSTNSVGREPDSTYMKAEILKRIYYPTGGYTDFDFETNQYLDTNTSSVKLAGGLRIRSIKNYDGVSGTPVTKFYKYGNSESGYGRPNFLMTDYFFYNQQHVEWWEYNTPPPLIGTPSEVAYKQRRTYYSNPAIDIQSEDGAPVVYEWVTEYAGNGSSVLGKTLYHFKDIPDSVFYLSGTNGDYNSYKGYVQTHFYNRGQPLSKKYYKKLSSGNFQPVQEETYLYNDSTFNENLYFGGLLFNQQVVRENVSTYTPNYADHDYYYHNYYIATDDNYITARNTITYNPEDSTKYAQTLTTIAYGNFTHQQPTTITTTNSKGEDEVVKMKYPADYSSGNPVLDSMLVKNIQAVPIEKWLTINKPGGNLVLKGNINTYKRLSNGLIVPDQQKELFASAGLSSFTISNVSSGVLQTDSHYQPVAYYDDFDNVGNVIQVHKANDTKISYVWDYNSGYPVAQVTNADSASIAYTSFEADGKGNWSFSGAISSDPTSPTGKKCYNISGGSITKSGLTSGTTYIVSYWTTNGSAFSITGTVAGYPIAGRSARGWKYFEHRITGQTSITISGSGYIDELRLYPADAQMITDTYSPLVGMTSQCDPNNRITYYKYDDFNRLSLVRDQDYNILKKISYNYVGQSEAGSSGPDTIYAKLSYENETWDSYSTWADVVVRFYSDAACTTPFSVTSLTAYCSEDVSEYYGGIFSGTQTYYYSPSGSGTYFVIASGAEIAYNDSWEERDHYFYLTAGGYTIKF